jgi:DNA-binding response OmpR family regulator
MYARTMAGIEILVVEDNAMQANLMSFLLEEAGHTVQIAESAEKALQVLRSFHPGLILMDLQLPGKDGLALARELRLNPSHVATPIIALTAYTDPADLARARQAGCDATMPKPIHTRTFARQVRNCLAGTAFDGDVPSDYGDLLTEVRNNFVAEGLEQCGTILRQLKSGAGFSAEAALRIVHRWAGMGGTLGFPEISQQARALVAVLTSTSEEDEDLMKAFQTSRRRFFAATRSEPKLQADLIGGLKDVRIGLIHFSEEEAHRIQTAATRAKVQVVMERLSEPIENQSRYEALIVNECGMSANSDAIRPQWSVPAVIIGSRSSLEMLSTLPARGHDFMIAPWDAEEVFLRVYRLIAQLAQAQPPGDSLHIQRRRPRVLIADDDPDLVALVSATLKQFGMDSDIARGGQQALEIASRRQPDAIVLDVNMFDLDGFEVLKKLRHNLATKAIPVLLLTARSLESDIGLGFGSGADDYVVKPFQPADLAERVSRLISARRKPGIAHSGLAN